MPTVVNPNIFLAGFVVMSLASLAIFAKGSKDPEIRHHVYIHSVVPFIAATSYLAMFFGLGTVVTADGVATLVPRYLDWSLTTPLLIAGLILAGCHEHGKPGGYLVGALIVDFLMIVAGLISSLTPAAGPKLAWYLWSTAAFFGVLYVLWAPVRTVSVAEGGPMNKAYQSNLVFLTIVWFLYPVVFALAPEGLKVIDAQANAVAILVLDVIAKVVYAFTSATNIERAHGERRARG